MGVTSVEFLGQACASIRCGEIDLISDPWFSGPAHLGSWLPYPAWSGDDLRRIRERVDTATHIYLSHHHEDHFDLAFLRTLSRKTILVGNFRNAKFESALQQLSSIHDIRVIDHLSTIALAPGITAQAILQQPDFRTDSMLLVRTPESVILNANDCGLDSEALRSLVEEGEVTVFMYTLNFMANGYPISYLRSGDPAFAPLMTAVRNETVSIFRAAMRMLRPNLSVAFAGPVLYADPVNAHLNRFPESVDWSRMVAELASDGDIAWPAPFSTIRCESRRVVARDLQTWPQPAPPQISELEILEAGRSLVHRLSAALAETNTIAGTDLVLSAVPSVELLEIAEPMWHLRMHLDPPAACRFVDHAAAAQAPYVQITSTAEILHRLLANDITVDDLLLSAKARFRRNPDTFNSTLHNLLRFGGDASSREALIEWTKRMHWREESITVRHRDETYEIPKYCPHEGESFEAATITEDGNLVCSRHKWTFCLATGDCISGDKKVNLYNLLPKASRKGA